MRGIRVDDKKLNPVKKGFQVFVRTKKSRFARATTQRFYNKYVKDCRIKQEERVTDEERIEIVKRIFGEIKRGLEENDAGVLIKRFGYFSVYMKPIRRFNGRYYKFGGYRYYPIFTPFTDDSDLKFVTMDYAFYTSTKKKIKEKLTAGHKYFSHRFSFKTMLSLSPKLLAYRKTIGKNKKG
jgi:hypothetical protein